MKNHNIPHCADLVVAQEAGSCSNSRVTNIAQLEVAVGTLTDTVTPEEVI